MVLANIVSSILGWQFFLDTLIVSFLIVAFFIGWFRGFWWSLWRFVFLVLLLGISYAIFLTPLVDFLNTGMWTTFGLSFNMSLGGTVYVIQSPVDYFEAVLAYVNNYQGGYLVPGSLLEDPTYVQAFSLAVLELVGFLVLLLINLLVSWIFTDLLYAVWGRRLFGSLRKVRLRPLGGIVGLAQGAVYVLLFAIVFAPLGATAETIGNFSVGPYKFDALYADIVEGLNPERSAILDLLDTQANSYRNPFGLFDDLLTFEHDGNPYSLVTQMVEYISQTDAPQA